MWVNPETKLSRSLCLWRRNRRHSPWTAPAKTRQNRPCNDRPSFLQNTTGWKNRPWNGFTTKPYLPIICILTVAQRDFHDELADKNECQMQHFMIFHTSVSLTTMGPTMAPLELLIKTFPGCIVQAKRCAVISSMSGRRGFQSARLDFQKNITKTSRISHIVTDHHFCKTPAASKILLGTVLLLNRIYNPYALKHSRSEILTPKLQTTMNVICNMSCFL